MAHAAMMDDDMAQEADAEQSFLQALLWSEGKVTNQHFVMMLVVATMLHLASLIWWHDWLKPEAETIQVKVLNLRIGSGGDIFIQQGEGGTRNRVDVSQAEKRIKINEKQNSAYARAASMPSELPAEGERERVMEAEEREALQHALAQSAVSELSASDSEKVQIKPQEKPTAEPPQAAIPEASTQASDEASQARMAEEASLNSAGYRYVRAPGHRLGTSQRQDAQVMARYEQLLSAWVQKHKRVPKQAVMQGLSGQAIVRIRINRKGTILYSKLEHNTGSKILDGAALDMVRRANPVPKVPTDYPAGQQFEFLIPVSFNAGG